MFTTTVTLPETQAVTIRWQFGDKDIIYFNLVNFTAPEYEGRITLFMSTGSLELRSLALHDSGEYSVSILQPGVLPMDGKTTLSVYGEQTPHSASLWFLSRDYASHLSNIINKYNTFINK
ncbi:hypothetical protein EYF80_066428 [Liparis tanakae]|uniref:Uncharacterized protein n=1 Tax=Liparis tanakae TaxID=230148 RepID=A0A4Z2E3Z3_9TELE|nr:hypothetical protein EYF80_066428 [Liparis tanakae]